LKWLEDIRRSAGWFNNLNYVFFGGTTSYPLFCPQSLHYKQASSPILASVWFNLYQQNIQLVGGFVVLTTVLLNVPVFWDVTPCQLVNCYRRFEGSYWLYFQGQTFVVEYSRRPEFSKHVVISAITFVSWFIYRSNFRLLSCFFEVRHPPCVKVKTQNYTADA